MQTFTAFVVDAEPSVVLKKELLYDKSHDRVEEAEAYLLFMS